VNHKFEIGVIEHDLAMGLRLHYDRVGAYNTDTNYESNGVGGFRDGVRGATSFDGLQQVLAKSVYLEDSIQLGQFSLRPGVRYEMLDVEYTYFEKTKSAITHRESDEELLMAGVGFNYEFFDVNSLFGGVYRGASPANPKGYVNQTEREESLGYELGFRHKNDALRAELVGFYTNFDDLLSPDLPGAGGTTEILNAGSADCMGLESVVQYDFGSANGWAYELPIYLSATYTHAEFSGINERLIDQYGLFAGAVSGNQIPYIPEWKLGAGIGLALEKWAANLDASYDSTSWGTGYNDDARSGNTSAMDGKIDSLLIFDLTGHYQLNSDLKLVGGIQNLFDTRKIVSRAPLGPRANAPRMIYAGLELEF
jgi:Fe(3+) dicitrate transport protein